MTSPDWLVARPIAHRGLHNPRLGVCENSRSAALAAIARGFAIECDVQLTADGDAVVFHDFTLDRLTGARGRVDAWSLRELGALPLKIGGETPLALDELVTLVGGRTPLICEIKSRFDGDLRLALRVAEIVADSHAPIAVKSFDPRPIAELRRRFGAASPPLGVVAMQDFRDDDADIDDDERRALAAMLHWDRTKPDFLSFAVDDLPHAAPHLARTQLGVPVMTWTVRTRSQASRARAFADQIVFEGGEAFV